MNKKHIYEALIYRTETIIKNLKSDILKIENEISDQETFLKLFKEMELK